jgi:hypothetical protein
MHLKSVLLLRGDSICRERLSGHGVGRKAGVCSLISAMRTQENSGSSKPMRSASGGMAALRCVVTAQDVRHAAELGALAGLTSIGREIPSSQSWCVWG